jgi:hypothetical protein
MSAIQTVKTSLLNNGSVLRMTITSEDIYFIFLETPIVDKTEVQEIGKDVKPLQWKKMQKEMLWNGSRVDDANHTYDTLKNNPLIGGGQPGDDCPGCDY